MERKKSPNEDYEICKWVVSDPGSYSCSPVFRHSLFIMYLHLEAINILLKW